MASSLRLATCGAHGIAIQRIARRRSATPGSGRGGHGTAAIAVFLGGGYFAWSSM